MNRARLVQVQPFLPSKDVSTSAGFYVDKLGFNVGFADSGADPKYVGLRRNGADVHVQWHSAREWDRIERPMLRFVAELVEELFVEYQAAGVFHQQTALRSTTWGTKEFACFDPDQSGLFFYRDLGPNE